MQRKNEVLLRKHLSACNAVALAIGPFVLGRVATAAPVFLPYFVDSAPVQLEFFPAGSRAITRHFHLDYNRKTRRIVCKKEISCIFVMLFNKKYLLMKKNLIKLLIQIVIYVCVAVAGYFGITLFSSCQGLHYWSSGSRTDSIYYEHR